jgi:hypothetical protein
MKKATGIRKVGRPKNNKTAEADKVFIGIKMRTNLAEMLRRDAISNFRMRGQHILWILSDYIDGLRKPPANDTRNKHIYTEEEMEDMYNQSKLNEGE